MLDKKFMIERQGKAFVLYAGLLDLAHSKGLIAITTELLQIPTESNMFVAVCKAQVSMQDGDTTRIFQGIGDASVANVERGMTNCLLRMAETRAKGRALRDAVNIGEVCMEELEPEARQSSRSYSKPAHDNYTPPKRTAPEAGSYYANSKPALTIASTDESTETNADVAASKAQVDAIRKLCVTYAQYELEPSKDPETMNRREASAEIVRFQTLIKSYKEKGDLPEAQPVAPLKADKYQIQMIKDICEMYNFTPPKNLYNLTPEEAIAAYEARKAEGEKRVEKNRQVMGG